MVPNGSFMCQCAEGLCWRIFLLPHPRHGATVKPLLSHQKPPHEHRIPNLLLQLSVLQKEGDVFFSERSGTHHRGRIIIRPAYIAP